MVTEFALYDRVRLTSTVYDWHDIGGHRVYGPISAGTDGVIVDVLGDGTRYTLDIDALLTCIDVSVVDIEHYDGPQRWEREYARTIEMPRQTPAYTRVRSRVWQVLSNAVRASASPYCAEMDSRLIVIDTVTQYRPDVVVTARDDDPMVCVVLATDDTRDHCHNIKRINYMCCSAIQHYIVVDVDNRSVTHYGRDSDCPIPHGGEMVLDPPGITVSIDDLYPPTYPLHSQVQLVRDVATPDGPIAAGTIATILQMFDFGCAYQVELEGKYDVPETILGRDLEPANGLSDQEHQ